MAKRLSLSKEHNFRMLENLTQRLASLRIAGVRKTIGMRSEAKCAEPGRIIGIEIKSGWLSGRPLFDL